MNAQIYVKEFNRQAKKDKKNGMPIPETWKFGS